MRIIPLRQRMIDDMTARHFAEKAQKDSIRCVKNLAAFIGSGDSDGGGFAALSSSSSQTAVTGRSGLIDPAL